jgi:hypothetical protein
MALIILLLLPIHPSGAQNTFPSRDKPRFKPERPVIYWKSPPIDLTETQIKELERLQREYAKEAIPLRYDLRTLRFELRYFISDPNVKPQVLFDKQRKISDLQAKLDILLLSYQIKARAIFMKEQLDRLPRDYLLGMGIIPERGFGIDREPQ